MWRGTKSTSNSKSETTEQCHHAAGKLSKDTKRNRRFVRITNRKQWRKQKKIQKEIQRGKKTVLNLSSRTLSSAEFRLLGKGLKYCPKPKRHDQVQLKQDVFEFTRRLRLREYFAAKSSQEDENTDDICDNNFEYVKRNTDPKSTFVPPSGRDTSLDFYIDSITNEILQNDKKYKYAPNLSQEELEALKCLRNDDSIVIKKADKGSTVVIMNRNDYIAEVERQLEDRQFYEKCDENPQEQFKNDISSVLNSINIPESVRKKLNPQGSDRIPVFYVLPKIHKQLDSKLPLGYPGRPIVSGCGSLTENISAYLDSILKPHMESLPSYVKDTSDFITKLHSLKEIPQNAFLVTLDVASLYSNIPHDDGIRACDHFMAEGGKSQETRTAISSLIKLVLTKNNFQFNDVNYLQVFGTAMGTKMAPSYASLFMGKLEMDFLGSCDKSPLIWFRFLDDIFMIWDHSEQDLQDFISKINNFHKTIKFTYNYSMENATFLDVNIKRNENGELDTSVHEKVTNCHQYIEFSSCHPLSCKQGIPYSQAKRYRRITSDNVSFENNLETLKEYFHERNYPSQIIEEAVKKVSSMSMEDALKSSSQTKCQNIIPFVCTYNPSLPNIGKIINQYWNLLKYSKSESVRKLHTYKPLVAYKRPTNLEDMLVHSRLNRAVKFGTVKKCNRTRCSHCSSIIESNSFTSTTVSTSFNLKEHFNCASTDVIYLITCKKCHLQYVGQTQQKCSQRMNKHKFDIKHFPDTPTTVAEHFNLPGHTIQDFSFMPIDKVSDNWKRLMKETSWMYRLGTVTPFGLNSKIMY